MITGADPGFGNGGAKILSVAHKSVADHPPLRGFPEATIKVYTWIFRISNCTPPPLVFFLSEATIKVYTWVFF